MPQILINLLEQPLDLAKAMDPEFLTEQHMNEWLATKVYFSYDVQNTVLVGPSTKEKYETLAASYQDFCTEKEYPQLRSFRNFRNKVITRVNMLGWNKRAVTQDTALGNGIRGLTLKAKEGIPITVNVSKEVVAVFNINPYCKGFDPSNAEFYKPDKPLDVDQYSATKQIPTEMLKAIEGIQAGVPRVARSILSPDQLEQKDDNSGKSTSLPDSVLGPLGLEKANSLVVIDKKARYQALKKIVPVYAANTAVSLPKIKFIEHLFVQDSKRWLKRIIGDLTPNQFINLDLDVKLTEPINVQ